MENSAPAFDPEAYTAESRRSWSEAAPCYDRICLELFPPMTRSFIAFVEPRPGQRLLDVACGSGAATLEAAGAVGPGGEVLGVDLSPGMLELARGRARAHSGARLEFREMNAERLDLPDAAFDAVVCQLGLMLFARPARALAEMARVARPGGIVSCLVQGEPEKMLFTSLVMRAMIRHAPELKVPGAPTLYAFGPPGALEGALSAAGLKEVVSARVSGTLAFASPREYWKTMTEGAGRTGAMLRKLSPGTRERIEAEVLEAAAAFRSGDGLAIPYECAMAKGVKPGR